MRYDAEHKEKTRRTVLREAAKAIRAEGPDRVSVAQVMAAAGLTVGGFYAHFASKDEMIAEAIATMFEHGRKRMLSAFADRSTEDGLCAYVDFYLSPEHRTARAVGCPLAALSADLPRMPQMARERFAEGAESLTQGLASRLAELGRDDAEDIARSVVSEMVGALSLSRAVPDGDQAEAFLSRSRTALKRRLGVETDA